MFTHFTKCALLYSVMAYSGAVYAHDVALPHSHNTDTIFTMNMLPLWLAGFSLSLVVVFRMMKKAR